MSSTTRLMLWTSALLLPRAVGAATLSEVDMKLESARTRLQSSTTKSARAMREALDMCREALDLLDQVDGVDGDVRDKKAARIMSMIYWCRKMMPLDLSGRMVSGAAPVAKAPQGGEATDTRAATRKVGPSLDEIAFKNAQAFERSHPERLQGIASRYATIAASYPSTTWGTRAADKEKSVRRRLEAARAAVLAKARERIHTLELTPVLLDLIRQAAHETSRDHKQRISEVRAEVSRLHGLHKRLKLVLATTPAGVAVSLADLGHAEDGHVRGGGKQGVTVAAGGPDGAKTDRSWKWLGAKGMVRLAERVLNINEAETLADVAVAATIVEDYTTAHRLFEKLLLTAPDTIDTVAAHFQRAFAGYRESAEGSATIRFKAARKLATGRKYGEAVRALTALQKDMAKDSALKEMLEEVAAYRRTIRRRHLLREDGKPMSSFERKVYKAFGGEAKLDERTGRIDIFYDFENAAQLRDWATVKQYGKLNRSPRWQVARGVVRCAGDRGMLMWKFPLRVFDIEADVSYDNRRKEVHIYLAMGEQQPKNTWFSLFGGAAYLPYRRPSGRTGRWYSSARFIWRAAEVAHLRFVRRRDNRYPFTISVNGSHGVSGLPRDLSHEGCFGFGFDGGTGTIDNVHIRGEVDMVWFNEVTRGIR